MTDESPPDLTDETVRDATIERADDLSNIADAVETFGTVGLAIARQTVAYRGILGDVICAHIADMMVHDFNARMLARFFPPPER